MLRMRTSSGWEAGYEDLMLSTDAILLTPLRHLIPRYLEPQGNVECSVKLCVLLQVLSRLSVCKIIEMFKQKVLAQSLQYLRSIHREFINNTFMGAGELFDVYCDFRALILRIRIRHSITALTMILFP